MSGRGLFSGREVGRPENRTFLLVLGMLGLVASLAMLWIGFNASKSIPGRSYFNIKAQFEEADQITRTGQVRIGAELVGQVSKAEVVDGIPTVELQLQGEYAGELPVDTRLEIRPRSPIGVRYVDLVPGTSAEMLQEGDTLGLEQTSATVSLDRAFDSLDPETRPGARQTLQGLGDGFADRGGDINIALSGVPSFLEGTDTVLESLNDIDGATRQFIRGSQGAANAADPVRRQIADGFEPEANSLEIFDEEGENLERTITEAPPTLQSASSELPAIRTLVSETGDFADAAQPALEAAPAALTQTSALLRESRTGLRDLEETLDLLDDATDPTLDLLDTVDPVLPNLNDIFKNSLPLTKELSPRGCDTNYFFSGWESMLQYGTAKHGVMRFELVTGDEQVDGGTDTVPQLTNFDPAPCELSEDFRP